MPELPEVESVKRSLKPYLIGKVIKSVAVREPKLVSSAGTKRVVDDQKTSEFVKVPVGQKIVDVDRVAKNILIVLESGNVIHIHLKMTGQLVFRDVDQQVGGGHPIPISESTLPNKHTHIIFELSKGTLFYNDIRKFGYVLLEKDLAQLKKNLIKKHGMDPLSEEFDVDKLRDLLQNSKKKIKTFLLDQDKIAGLGNIYVDESLFASGIHPLRVAGRLSSKEIEGLRNNIVDILSKAIEMGGSSVANYILADGSRGTYAREHKVYKKAGQPCTVCKTPLQKIVVGSRGTVFCPKCQKIKK
jgi:formamidopyrimidine-DNA glycosylase